MISIIIPVHDRIEFLAECLESCTNQNYSDYEVIVVKSGSNPEVEKTLNIFKPFIKIIETTENNVAKKLNLGIENSKGEWIKTCSSDDILRPYCLSEFAKVAKDTRKYYYSPFHYVNQYNIIEHTYDALTLVAGFFSKELWKAQGKFNEIVTYEDKEFIEKIAKSDLVYVPKPTSLYRNHIGQITKKIQER